MATNNVRWIRNLMGASEPLVLLGLFQAGATQAIKRGELLEFTGNTNTAWVPMDSDFAMNGNVAIANEQIKSGDRAGYYEIIVPRPGDVFEYALAAAADLTVGQCLYYSSSEAVTETAGTYPIGYSVGQEHYPDKQGHLADDATGDAGTTIGNTSYARFMFNEGASFFAKVMRRDRLDIGDAGGFSGLAMDSTGSVQNFIDGTLSQSFEADGSTKDEVS